MKSRYFPALFLLAFGVFGLTTNIIRAEATVGCGWTYQVGNTKIDEGSVNYGVFSGNFSNLVGSFGKVTDAAKIAVSASEGRVHVLNKFEINDGSFQNVYSQFVTATAGAGFADRLTIVDPSRTGQPGTFTGSIRVNLDYIGRAEVGSANVFGVGAGDTLASARAASQNIFYDNGGRSTYAYIGFGPSNPQSFNNRIVSFTVPFTFGEEFGMAVWMESYIGTGNRTRIGTAKSHDASNTVDWAGTVAVQDVTGTNLSPGSFSLTSQSSRNYLTEIIGGASFSSWVLSNGLTGQDALPSADTNQNGYSNLLDYAFGFDPVGSGASGRPIPGSVVIGGQNYLTLTYTRPAGTEVSAITQSAPPENHLLGFKVHHLRM